MESDEDGDGERNLPQVLIRSATFSDASAIAQVHVEGWRTAYKNFLPDHVLSDLSVEARKNVWLEILGNESAHAFTFVAETDGTIVGFVNGGPERTSDTLFVAEIYAIYLLENHRRQGVGTALFRTAVEFLVSHRLDSMKVWVLSDNPYRSFYERHGGCVVGEKPITIGGKELIETAYGWKNVNSAWRSTSIEQRT